MAWRVFSSLLVLRDQVNTLAPDRAKGADGTICDTNHPTTSDHCPHDVPGVGPEMVSALDLTHDPAGGFDSYRFAEVLRSHRDKRIKYVISNHQMFSSYATSGYAAWTWRPYSGTDPHTNHVHISVLDAAISDDKTPWNLEGFMATQFNSDDIAALRAAALAVLQYSGRGIGENNGSTIATSMLAYFDQMLDNGRVAADAAPKTATDAATAAANTTDIKAQVAALRQQVVNLQATCDLILAKLNQGGGGTPMTYIIQGTATPAA